MYKYICLNLPSLSPTASAARFEPDLMLSLAFPNALEIPDSFSISILM